MNKPIMTEVGFEEEVKLVEEGRCPFCKRVIDANDFKSDDSRREYLISGLCSDCQDQIFSTPVIEE